jgi:hypothetical protein
MGNVLHASGSGYFPRCVVTAPGLPSDNNYISGSITEVMNVFWRVKKWELSISGTLQGEGGANIWNFNGANNELFNVSPLVEKEEDLVCFNSSNKFYITFRSDNGVWGTYTYTQEGDTFTVPLQSGVNIGFALLTVGLGYLTGGSYATFEANSIVKNDNAWKVPFAWGLASFSLLSDSFGQDWIPVGTYTIDALGVSAISRTLYGPTYTSGSVTAIVSAKEYWSYAGTYNPQTGQPL